MYLDLGRKLEHLEETSEAQQKHANTTHRTEAAIQPPSALEVQSKCVKH